MVAPFGTSSFHEHVLAADSFTLIKEAGVRVTSTVTSAGTTCTFSADIHVTDVNPYTGTGHFQYSNISFVSV